MATILVNCLFVGIGGFAGSVLRYLAGLLVPTTQPSLPWVTFAINVIGAFAIGFIATRATVAHEFDPHLLLFLKVGLCGGFTTFSTFSLESLQLIEQGRTVEACVYMVASAVVCLVACLAGCAVGRLGHA